MQIGRVKWFNEIKGIGVIRGAGGREYPVHFGRIIDDGFRTLFEGETVEFDVILGDRGDIAVNVRRSIDSIKEGDS